MHASEPGGTIARSKPLTCPALGPCKNNLGGHSSAFVADI
jgi:hypothetical protein